MARPKSPPIVAELGRPETPEEAAERKAASSLRRRSHQTPINLLLSIAASLGIVLFLVLVVVRPDQAAPEPIDYRAIAVQAQPDEGDRLAAPVLPPGWSANRAVLQRVAGGGLTWSIGFLTPDQEFIALEQGVQVSEAWLPGYLGRAQPTSTIRSEGLQWQVYDQRGSNVSANFAYSLAAESGDSRYLLHGSASDEEFRLLSSAIAAELANERE